MKDVTAKMANKTGQIDDKAGDLPKKETEAKTQENIRENTALDRCYGAIGISAVVAAARYQGGFKNPAYAPVQTKWDQFASEAA